MDDGFKLGHYLTKDVRRRVWPFVCADNSGTFLERAFGVMERFET